MNYTVSSNENIFELIKVDIIKQLYIQGYIDFGKEDYKISSLNAAVKYAIKHPLELGRYLSKSLSKLNPIAEFVGAGFAGVHELIKSFEEFEKKLNNKLNPDKQELLDYYEGKALEIGSYLEFNIISELISNVIKKIKSDKKVILYIDDIDRLDPEHIFRILNVFSSHHDYETNEHKFGFDKVIIVCHIDNIKSIFHHKYGADTDFNGYMDKFFSDEVFEFSNEDAIQVYLNSTEFLLPKHELFLFKQILKQLLEIGSLKTRQLIKHKILQKPENYIIDKSLLNDIQGPIYRHIQASEIWFESDNVPVLYMIKYLTTLLGSLANVRSELKKLATIHSDINYCV